MPLIKQLASRIAWKGVRVMSTEAAGNVTGTSMAFVTVPDMDTAKKIASGVVTNKLAACVNIIPGVTSVYEWEGKIENDSELILMIKSRTSRVEELTKFVRENHPYSVCEVISSEINSGNPPYIKWIKDFVPEK